MKGVCLSFIFMFLLAGFAYAGGDIVYSARCYYPPGSKGTSHFHLYRINPDGTGKHQITFGRGDDDNPVWSPDGTQVLFTRESLRGDRKELCLISDRGGPVTRLLDVTKYAWPQYTWSPDKQEIAVDDGSAFIAEAEGTSSFVDILNVKTRKQQHLRGSDDFCWSPNGEWYYVHDGSPHIVRRRLSSFMQSHVGLNSASQEFDGQDVVWAGNQAVVKIDSEAESKQVYLAILNRNGVQKRRVLCCWPNYYHLPKDKYDPTNDPYIDGIDFGSRSLLPLMPSSRDVVYVQDVGNSGDRPCNDYWHADTVTGKMTEITNGQFLTWASDGQRFCTSPAHGEMDYGKTGKSLYVASLEIGSVKSDKLKEIVTGLVWVTGADWRRRKQ